MAEDVVVRPQIRVRIDEPTASRVPGRSTRSKEALASYALMVSCTASACIRSSSSVTKGVVVLCYAATYSQREIVCLQRCMSAS